MPPNGVQGQRPWHAFGDFRRETKVTRGAGRSARSRGEQRGNAPRIFGVCRGLAPAPAPRGDAVPPSPIPRNAPKVARQHATSRKKSALRSSHHGAKKRRGKFLAFWGMSGATPPDYFFVYLPSFSKTVLSSVETLNSLLAAKSCSALAAFWMLVSVPAPPTQPPGQAMPSSR